MSLAIREIMTVNPICLAADTLIADPARKMKEHNIGDVVVEKNGKLCGIVTDRDIVVRAVAESKDASKTNLESICSKDVTSLGPDQTDEEAVQLMKEKALRRLPVVQNGKVVGIVSLGDLAIHKDRRSALGHISAASANV
jgi:CBS domain-containing protein